MAAPNSYSQLDTLVRADKLKLLFEQSFPAIFVSLIAGAVFSLAFLPVHDPSILINWFLLLLVTAGIRYILFSRYRRAQPQGEDILVWEKPYFVTLTLTTLLWGVGSLIIMPADSPIHQMLVLVFMLGLSGGALSLYSAHRLMTAVTISILMVPITLSFLFQGNAFSLVIVAGLIIFFISSIRATRFIESTLDSNFTLTRELRDREEQLRLAGTVFNHSQDGIFVTDVNGKIVDANPACLEITGYTRDEIIGQNPSMFSSGKHTPDFYGKLWSELTASGRWQGEIWNRQKNGGVYAQRISIDAVENEHGERSHYVAIFHDISHLKEHEAELHEMAYHDVLTGLPNRLLLRDRMDFALKQAKRHGKEVTVCYLDLDDFKPINDTFGHNAGDQILIEVAARLLNTVRESDTVARMGGDEFVILLVDYDKDTARETTLQRILDVVSTPYNMAFGQVAVTASVGIASTPQDTSEAGELLRRADRAMYTAKSSGRNQYRFYSAR